MNPFSIISKNSLGVDVGTSSIKIVELSHKGASAKLENYGEIRTGALYEKQFETFSKNILTLPSKDISRGIRAILEEAGMSTQHANFSIPDFASFFTTFSLPPMTKNELPQAIKFEARRHIPLSFSEVTLDWQIVKGAGDEKSDINVLLVAVSNQIIRQYQALARLSGLSLGNLEAEIFGLLRATVKDDKPTILLDIGAQSSAISAVVGKKLKSSYSFDISGDFLTKKINKILNINYQEADKLKKENGLFLFRKDVRDALLPAVNSMSIEIKKISQGVEEKENKKIEKIVLAGAGSSLPGLREFFSGKFEMDVEIATPFKDIITPAVLDNKMQKIGPNFAIALGAAIGGLK
jgi:type IV pilus assembly protein PilM